MDRKKILNKLYKDYKKNNSYHKSAILYLIIQIKSECVNVRNYKKSIYLDIKYFIKYYVNSVEKKDYGYDQLNIQKLINAIDASNRDKERYELAIYASRQINLNGYEKELNEFKNYKDSCKTKSLRHSKSINDKLRLLSHLCSYNLKVITIILFTIFLVSNLIFLPAKYEVFELFHLHYRNYSDSFYLNHMLNLVTITFGLENDNIITPLNWLGVIILALLKSIYILLIVNYLYQKVLNIMYEN